MGRKTAVHRDTVGNDPFELMGKLFKKDRRSTARVYEVVRVAGVYVQLGATKKHKNGAKRPDYTARWYDHERLERVEQ